MSNFVSRTVAGKFLYCLVALLMLPGIAQAQWPQEQKLIAIDAASLDRFGISTSVSGDVAVIGSGFHAHLGVADSGSAYVFRWDGTVWFEEAELIASDATADDLFGTSVSVSGDVAVIGAPLHDHGGGTVSGSAYVFRWNGTGWVEEAELTAFDAAANDNFGFSVSVSGDVAVIGAFHDSDAGGLSGSAYVYRYNGTGWVFEAKLTASDAAADDRFGFSVSVFGDVVLIGALLHEHGGVITDSGSAYVYRYDGTTGWFEEAELTAIGAAVSDGFGISVSVSGDTAVIGAHKDDAGGVTDSGSAYVFRWSGMGWVQEFKLTAFDSVPADQFGLSVSVSGDVAVIGSPFHDDGGSSSGSAYVFRYDGTDWVHEFELKAFDAAANDQFGRSVSVSGDMAVIGAFFDIDGGINPGSAYFYRFTGPLGHAEEQKLIASDADIADVFGVSVSVSGDVAVTGAQGDDDAPPSSGSAYVHRWDGSVWLDEAKLTASDAAANDNFGFSVSVSGDVAVIGAWHDDSPDFDAGSAYVYRYDGTVWVQEFKLTASDAAVDDEFGVSVSVSGDVAVVGAWRDGDAGSSFSGSAYVYRYDGAFWVEEAKLTAFDAEAGDIFGRSVSVSGDVAVIGSQLDDDGGNASGSAYVYRYDGAFWVEEAKLTASDAAAGDQFGTSVSVSGDVAVIGSQFHDDVFSGSGSAYVYRYDGAFWVEEAKLTASDAEADDQFGLSVSVFGDMVVIGAPENDDVPPSSGSAYVYRYDGTGWFEETKLIASDAEADDRFGWSVSAFGDVSLIGAVSDDAVVLGVPLFNSGSAYVFRGFGNAFPMANAGLNSTVECGNAAFGSTTITLDGSGSSDADGDPLTFLWTTAQAGAIFDDATLETPTLDVTGVAVGTVFEVTLIVDDGVAIDQDTTSVEVLDTIAPLIVCPADIVQEPTAPEGNIVFYVPLATDDCDTSVAIVSNPPSGSLFAVGTSTSVTCTATDDASNQAQCSFTVTILSLAATVDNIETTIENLNTVGTFNDGEEVSFTKLIGNVDRSIETGKLVDACFQIQEFIDKAQAQIDSGKMTQKEGDSLIDSANNLATTVGC